MTDPGGWRKSSHAAGHGPEVTVCREGHIEIRNSRYPDEFLAFTSGEWAAFIAGVKNGEFDLPAGTGP